MEDSITQKVCAKCRERKPLDAFYFRSRKRNILESWCKVCKNADQRNRYNADASQSQKESLPEGLRRCRKCLEIKLLDSFYMRSRARGTYESLCKICTKEVQHSRYGGKPRLQKKPIDQIGSSESKMCSACGEIKPYSEFFKDSSKRHGLASRCKICTRQQNRKPPSREVLLLETVPEEHKKCACCQEIKLLEDFSREASVKDKRNAWCRQCRNKAKQHLYRNHPKDPESVRKKRLERYNLTQPQYDVMLAAQGGVCAICGHPETKFDIRINACRRLGVDHCHETGRVRALLCNNCNIAFGLMLEDPERIQALLAYAEKWKR